MGKFKIGIKFDIKLLNTLTNNINSGVEILRSKHHLSLHPIHLNDFNKSIRDILSGGIAKYNKNLSGILLGYQNIKLPVDIGFINYDSCYIHIDLEADFFVFKPEIGKEMQGVVNRKNQLYPQLMLELAV
ncbi:hypothetical protein NQ314_012525 [Rhamnusium bicolor]|uniref:Uncharacterized protein n=1 Tax=Rhamnusium bicolor TaxID=1586634 RepID=A0AAV8XC30_9CUCU|nr:hypothetical protein NQ314_012525 [Rhamnusium bicolor]